MGKEEDVKGTKFLITSVHEQYQSIFLKAKGRKAWCPCQLPIYIYNANLFYLMNPVSGFSWIKYSPCFLS